jgi:nucleoside-diphosphate-sugar epimerase/putative sterol carrier protein
MRVVVTGGSGQLGTLVLQRLIDWRKVKRIVSLDVQPPLVASGKLEAITADVRDPQIRDHLAGADALIHLAFIVTSKVPREIFDAVNVGGSKNVFLAAVDAGVKQIVYASSIAQYGVLPGHPEPIVETTPRRYQHDFPYAAAKYRVEELLDALEAEHPELAVARLRPAVLIGTRFQNPLAKLLGRALDRGVIPSTSDARLPLVWDEDVADAVILSLKSSARGAFNLGAREQKSARELAAATGLRVVHLPGRAMATASKIGDALSRFGMGEAVDPTWRENGDVPMIIDSEKARRELGWSPKCDTATQVVQRYLEVAPRKLDRRIDAFLRLMAALAKRDRSQEQDLKGMRSRVHLQLTGRGGGDISIVVDGGALTFGRGIPRPPTSVATLPASLFKEILTGKTTYSTAQLTGRIKLQGDTAASFVIGAMSQRLRIAQGVSGLRGTAARAFARWLEGGTA